MYAIKRLSSQMLLQFFYGITLSVALLWHLVYMEWPDEYRSYFLFSMLDLKVFKEPKLSRPTEARYSPPDFFSYFSKREQKCKRTGSSKITSTRRP